MVYGMSARVAAVTPTMRIIYARKVGGGAALGRGFSAFSAGAGILPILSCGAQAQARQVFRTLFGATLEPMNFVLRACTVLACGL